MENTIESFVLCAMDDARPSGRKIVNAEFCTASFDELFTAARDHAKSVGACHCTIFGMNSDGRLTRFLTNVWTFTSTGRESVETYH